VQLSLRTSVGKIPTKTDIPLTQLWSWVDPRSRSGRVRKTSLLLGFDPLTAQPIAIRYTGPQFPVIDNPLVPLHVDFDAWKNENSLSSKPHLSINHWLPPLYTAGVISQ